MYWLLCGKEMANIYPTIIQNEQDNMLCSLAVFFCWMTALFNIHGKHRN